MKKMKILAIDNIPAEKILKESVYLDEKRSNPDKNIKTDEFEKLGNVIENIKREGLGYLTFFSFRSNKHTTLINPDNKFSTPTGLYAYPYTDYIENRELYNYANIENIVPFVGENKPNYIYVYILKNMDGIVDTKQTINELKKYFDLLKNDPEVNSISKESIEVLFTQGNNEFEYFFKSKINAKWWFNSYNRSYAAYLWTIMMHNFDINKFGSKCREYGINGFVDYGSGFIHQNEKTQAVFFRSREIFQKIEIIKIGKNEEINDYVEIKDINSIKRLSRNQVKSLLIKGDIKKFTNKIYYIRVGENYYIIDKNLNIKNKKPIVSSPSYTSNEIELYPVEYMSNEHGWIDGNGEPFPKDGRTFYMIRGFQKINNDYYALVMYNYNTMGLIKSNGEPFPKDGRKYHRINSYVENNLFKVIFNDGSEGYLDLKGNEYDMDMKLRK